MWSSPGHYHVWNLNLTFVVSRVMDEEEVGGRAMSAGDLKFEEHFSLNVQFAVSATIPWQEGKEEDFAELREGLRSGDSVLAIVASFCVLFMGNRWSLTKSGGYGRESCWDVVVKVIVMKKRSVLGKATAGLGFQMRVMRMKRRREKILEIRIPLNESFGLPNTTK